MWGKVEARSLWLKCAWRCGSLSDLLCRLRRRDQLEGMALGDLKEVLRKHNEPVSGKKPEVVDRLVSRKSGVAVIFTA